MNRLFTLLIVVAVAVSACTESTSAPVAQNKVEKQEIKVQGNRLLTMEISGMVCEMGCGSTIRKELSSTLAVESCKFDFQEGRKSNLAKITFDKDKISVDKLVEIVSSINKGQFKVGETKSEDVSVNNQTSNLSTSGSRGETAKIQVAAQTSFEIPNLLEILASFFEN